MRDVGFNTTEIITTLEKAATQGARLALFPELCVTGYSCGDLFYQGLLLSRDRATRWSRSSWPRP